MKFFESNKELKANLEAAQESLKDANARLAELENAAEDIKTKDEQIANQTVKIANLENEKASLENDIVELNESFNEERDEMDATFKAYKQDADSKISQLEAELEKAEGSTNAKAKEIVASVGHKENIVPEKEEGGKKELSREEFNKLDAKGKSLFCINGGKIK